MLIPANRPFPIIASFANSGLFIGLRVFDVSSGAPVQITGQPGQTNGVYPMLSLAASLSYQALFTGTNQKPYLFVIDAYTDGTYTSVNNSIPEQSFGAFCTILSPVIAQGLVVRIGCQDQPRQRPVVVAQNSDMPLVLTFEDECGRPLDCTTATAVQLSILEADGATILTKTLAASQIARVAGSINQFLVTMLAADYELLPTGNNDAEVELVMGNTFNVNVYASVDVQPAST